MIYPPDNEHPKVVLKTFHGPRVRSVSPLQLYHTVFDFFFGQETLKSFGLSSFGFGGTNTHVSGIAAEKLPETTVAPEVKRGETVREGLVVRIWVWKENISLLKQTPSRELTYPQKMAF